MKKALALVLALVLALSMAVSAFAAVITLTPVEPAEDKITKIPVVNATDDHFFYTHTDLSNIAEGELGHGTEYYISLGDDKLQDIKLTANGNLTAELVKFDPEKMVLTGAKTLTYTILVNGEVLEDAVVLEEAKEVYLEAAVSEENPTGKVAMQTIDRYTEWSYADACVLAKLIKNHLQVKDTDVVVCDQPYVNIVKITVADNFTAAYTKGTLKVEAYNASIKKNVAGSWTVINDVAIFEYEQVKWAAENNAKGASLQLGAAGYSDLLAAKEGYSFFGEKYDPENLRNEELRALVVSTTAFRAIERKNLPLELVPAHDFNDDKVTDMAISVTLKEIAKGQKGVNFFAWADVEDIELKPDTDAGEEFDRYPSAVSFGFLGEQVIKGAYEIDVLLPINYYELRELFGLKVEEEDIISYYVVDQDNNVVKTIKVDYMTDDISENVEFTVEGEANPNTGAESVVGVVAALAVVSVATAAAVSLKK